MLSLEGDPVQINSKILIRQKDEKYAEYACWISCESPDMTVNIGYYQELKVSEAFKACLYDR